MISGKAGFNVGSLARWGLGLALAVVPGLCLPARAQEPAVPASKVTVIDARTLDLDGRRIRLAGIDAPDLDQTCRWGSKEIACGRIARTALIDLVTAADVTCTDEQPGPDGITIATCFAGGFDIGANMVHTGWALAGPGAPPRYAETEKKARAARRGLWRGQFDRPEAWRRSHR